MRLVREWWSNSMARLSEIIDSSSFAYSAWHHSLMLALWGVWLMLPNGTFNGPAFATMESMASAFTWGLVAFVIGIAKMHFVLTKKTISLSLMCFATGWIWVITGVAFLTSVPGNTGAIIYMMLGFHEFWLYKRLSRRTPR